MEKYNVFKLYVVKKEDYYFICEKTAKEKTYIEIFTKEELENVDPCNVESLKDYYPLLSLMNYATMEPLKLTKKELLIKYAEINSSHIETKKRHSSNYETMIKHQEEYIKVLKELEEKNPEKAKELAIESLKRTGILDEKGQVAYPYSESLSNNIISCTEDKNIRTLKK